MTTITQDFTLGEPQVAGPLAVFPVFGPEPGLDYRVFADASALGAFVKERDQAADVGALVVGNPTDLSLLIYEGEEVLGAQQNRTFDMSVLVGAGATLDVPVSCVEQGRWDGRRHDERFSASPQAADPSLRRLKRRAANASAAAGGPVKADQGEVWDHVLERIDDNYVVSPSAAMSDLYDQRGDRLQELASVKPVERQVGAVAEIGGVPIAIDLVSQPQSFASLLPRLARGYALDALGQPDADPDAEAASGLLREALHAARLPQATPGLGRGFGIVAPRAIGSGLDFEDELIQLCAFPGDGGPSPAAPASGQVARPSRRRRRLA